MDVSSEPEVFNVVINHKQGHLWNSKDVQYARTNHRIVGCMVGSLPRHPHQTAVLGLPLKLMPEEVTLLLEKRLARPVCFSSMENRPSENMVDKFRQLRQKSYEEQVTVASEQRKREIENNAERILRGKIKKLQKKNSSGKSVGADANVGLTKEKVIEMECSKIQKLPEHHQLIQIFTEHPMIECLDYEVADWSYPTSGTEKLKYAVYKDLWEKELFITSGSKFGGDFLVYRGDPILFHATYIVKCVKKVEEVDSCDLMTLSRLANATKKTLVLASFKDDKLHYTSFQLVEDKLISDQVWE